MVAVGFVCVCVCVCVCVHFPFVCIWEGESDIYLK